MITREEYNKALDIVEAYHKQLFIGSVIRPLACPKCGGFSMFKSALYWNCNSCDESWIEG